MAKVVFSCELEVPDHYLHIALEDPYGYLIESGIDELWSGVVTAEAVDE